MVPWGTILIFLWSLMKSFLLTQKNPVLQVRFPRLTHFSRGSYTIEWSIVSNASNRLNNSNALDLPQSAFILTSLNTLTRSNSAVLQTAVSIKDLKISKFLVIRKLFNHWNTAYSMILLMKEKFKISVWFCSDSLSKFVFFNSGLIIHVCRVWRISPEKR